MDVCRFGKKFLSQVLVMSFIITGCMPSDVPTTRNLNKVTGGGTTTCPIGANCADGDTDTVGDADNLPPKVEIRHLIEPNLSADPNYSTGTGVAGGGSYVRKLTLPKNFAGRLYLAGINVGSLTTRFVKVRFKFGINQETVVIPATVAKAPGITPAADISVLVMDLRSEPFRSIRLPYDLFDYNEYTTGQEPVQDNRNSNLYCRGLKVEDDPTFQGVGACDGQQSTPGQPDEECLYAYAKVQDQGLVKLSGSVKVPLLPSFPQVKSTGGVNYYQDTMAQKLLKPLPDTVPGSGNVFTAQRFSDAASPINSSNSVAITFAGWNAMTILGSQYYYRGPYRLMNRPNWQFAFPYDQLHGKNRLFRENSWVVYPNFSTDPLPDDYPLSGSTPQEQTRIYYNSYLFPLATKLDLGANVAHLSSNDPNDVRSEQILSTAGKTVWMDGSNARAQSRNTDLEHVGSCNVSGTIEIFALDDNGTEFKIATSNEVKLQLVRPTQYKTDTGNEVLYTNFKSCTSNAGCGGSECCFNNRCWDNTLVSQCLDSSATGNRIIGESCSTDLECSSLCCNRTSGQCSPHNTVLSPAVLCSKPIGDFCIAKDWCQKTTITKCLIVQQNPDPITGAARCGRVCYSVQEFGDCKAGVCVPPPTPVIPAEPDLTDPNACNDAVPAPDFSSN